MRKTAQGQASKMLSSAIVQGSIAPKRCDPPAQKAEAGTGSTGTENQNLLLPERETKRVPAAQGSRSSSRSPILCRYTSPVPAPPLCRAGRRCADREDGMAAEPCLYLVSKSLSGSTSEAGRPVLSLDRGAAPRPLRPLPRPATGRRRKRKLEPGAAPEQKTRIS